MSGPKRSQYWGLTACRPDLHCAVCLEFAGQPEELQRLRDWYCEGMHELVLVEMFEVPLKDLHRHCWQHGWVRRKKWNQPALHRTVERLILGRLGKSWNLVSPTSADRMLEMLMKMVAERSDL